jgi:predicted dehydrogenase
VNTVLNIGMLGYGAIGRVHAMGYQQLPFVYPDAPSVRMRAVCTSSPETSKAAQTEAGFESSTTDLAELLDDPEINVVDVCLPNHLHREVIIQALAAGKNIYCEKPMAGSARDARAIQTAAGKAAGFLGMVFQYRFIPAIIKARKLVVESAIGKVYSFRAEYLHSGYQDATKPLSWRMNADEAGSGALGDLGSHVIDLVCYLLGEFDAVQGHIETFVKDRPIKRGAPETGPVTVDDAAWFTARLKCGALGTVECSRFATGTLDDLRLWIYGEQGSIHFSLMDPSFLYWYDAGPTSEMPREAVGWQRLDTVTAYPGAKTPPPRSPFGWSRSHLENQYQFLKSVANGFPPEPGVAAGLHTQLVIDAVQQSHAKQGAWQSVEEK